MTSALRRDFPPLWWALSVTLSASFAKLCSSNLFLGRPVARRDSSTTCAALGPLSYGDQRAPMSEISWWECAVRNGGGVWPSKSSVRENGEKKTSAVSRRFFTMLRSMSEATRGNKKKLLLLVESPRLHVPFIILIKPAKWCKPMMLDYIHGGIVSSFVRHWQPCFSQSSCCKLRYCFLGLA